MLKQTPKKRVLFVRRFTPVTLALFGVFCLLGTLAFDSQLAFATDSTTINFQARLQSQAGAVVPDSDYNIQFKLYDAPSGGNLLWTETYLNSNGQGLSTINGYFTTSLGSLTSFPSTIDWSQQLYLTMNIGGTGTGSFPGIGDGEMDPRLPLTASPYAFQAKKAASADSLVKAGSGVSSSLSIQTPTAGNQTFLIQDQGAAGTYNLLTAPSGSDGYVKLQGGTITTQTGSLALSGSVIAPTLQSADGTGASSGITLRTGNSTSSGNTGTVTIASGNATSGNSGSISIDTGTASGTTGTISIGTTNASGVSIGKSGATTTIGGSLNTTQLLTASGGIAISSGGALTNGIAFSGTIGTDIQRSSGTLTMDAAGGFEFLTGGDTQLTIDDGGAVTLQNSTDSVAAFQVLSSPGAGGIPLFTVDTTNSYIYVGSTTDDANTALLVLDSEDDGDPEGINGAMYYDSSSNKFRCFQNDEWVDCIGSGGPGGPSSSTSTITLVPEYQGGVLTADGSNNNGTMVTDFLDGLGSPAGYKHNFYEWSTSQATTQDYDIVINHQLPSDFNASTEFDAGSWKVWTYVDNTTDAAIAMTVYDSDGTACANGVSIMDASTGWKQITLTDFDTNTNCNFTADSMITIRIKMSSKTPSSNKVRVGEIQYSYTS